MKSCFVRLALSLVLALAAGVILLLLGLKPLDREYALRLLRMGESDVNDYLRFPERTIDNPPQAFLLETDPHPEWFMEIEYTARGKTHRASVDELMEQIRTQALIVIQDDRIVYEQYYNGYRRD